MGWDIARHRVILLDWWLFGMGWKNSFAKFVHVEKDNIYPMGEGLHLLGAHYLVYSCIFCSLLSTFRKVIYQD